MRNRFNFGQQAIELALLLGVLFLAGIGVIYLFSDRIESFFKNNSVMRTSIANSSSESTPAVTSVEVVSNSNVEYYEDGSIKLSIEGVTLNYPKTFVDSVSAFGGESDFGDFQQTTGSSGMEMVVEELEELIKDYKLENPGQEPIVKVYTGTGKRVGNGTSIDTYEGVANANLLSMSVDDEVVIIQSDQTCKDPASCDQAGIYKVKGNVVDGVLDANVTADLYNSNMQVDTEFKPSLDIADFTLEPSKITVDAAVYNWKFDFTEQY